MKSISDEFEMLVSQGAVLTEYPVCEKAQSFKEALDKMNSYGLGFCVIGKSADGILTDGDIRRLISKGNKPFFALCSERLGKVATFPCATISSNDSVDSVLEVARKGITYIPIINEQLNELYVLDVKRFNLVNA